MKKANDLKALAQKYRKEIFEKMVLINQGHPGSIFSMMDLVVSLYYQEFLRFDKKKKRIFGQTYNQQRSCDSCCLSHT